MYMADFMLLKNNEISCTTPLRSQQMMFQCPCWELKDKNPDVKVQSEKKGFVLSKFG